jgi:hypothetical protein
MALLGNLKGSAQAFQDTEFYNGIATQSLRFDIGSTAYLTRTPSSASNRKTFTASFWFKPSKATLNSGFFVARTGSSGTYSLLAFSASDNRIRIVDNQTSYPALETSAKYRDLSAWYHMVFAVDTTQSTSSNRLKVYVNGEEQSYAATNYYSQDADTNINSTAEHYIGRNAGVANLDGYLAEYNFIDGSQLTPTSFGETKNGVWIPKEYTGSYGTNGFRLEFKNTSVGSGSSSTIGADTSGNDNHFDSNGIATTDCNIPDSPENNFCTLNPIARRYGQSYVGTFTEGALKFVSGGNATNVFGTMAINQIASQGGVYFELRFDSIDSARTYFGVIGDNGINNKNPHANSGGYTFPIKGMLSSSPRGYFTTDTDASNDEDLTANTAFSNGDVAGIAILSDGKFFVHRNGTYLNNADGNTGNPSTGANPIATIDLTEGDWLPYLGYSSSYSANFGQDSTFAGQESSGGNSDANGIGDFKYAVPTNCLALCTSNMAEPTIGPNSATQADSYMDVLNYTGNNTINTDISGLNFKPDLIWTFARGSASTHNLATDSSRGVHKDLFLSTGGGESNDTDGILAFNSDGFRLGTSTNHNVNLRTYTTFNWRANGGTTTTNDASATSIGSIDSVIQANTTAGFSIVTYTGDSTGNNGTASTVAHGLGAVPKWIITIPLNVNDGAVYHQQNTTAPETDTLILASVSGNNPTYDGSGFWNDTAPTSTVFSVGSRRHTNSDGGVVAYCWTDIEGFSKFGSFIGNSNNDGPFIYTGFQPAWVMLKNGSRSADWRINDTTRQPKNDDGGHLLLANSTSAEITNEYDMDFLSNGFKLKSSDVYENGSNELIVYMAFAGVPFKYANAN